MVSCSVKQGSGSSVGKGSARVHLAPEGSALPEHLASYLKAGKTSWSSHALLSASTSYMILVESFAYGS